MRTLLILLLLIPTLGTAQEPAFVKVVGQAVHVDKEPTFKGSVVLSSSFSSFPSEAINLNQMKLKYDEALKKNGLKLNDLIERVDLYTRMGYDKEGTVYEYETTELQQFQQFLSSTSFGIQRLTYDTAFTINPEETSKLVAEALENARVTATISATEIGKTLGSVMWVEDNNRINTEIRKGLYHEQKIGEHFYEITVQFKLED